MKEEILKILEMNRQGKLSDEQTAELLSTLFAEPATAPPPPAAEGAPETDDGSGIRFDWAKVWANSRRMAKDARTGLGNLGETINRAVCDDMGTITELRGRLSTLVGQAVEGLDDLGDRIKDELREGKGDLHWVDDSNVIQMSQMDAPNGEGYTAQDNRINVSSVRDLTLRDSIFSDNAMQAVKVSSLSATDASLSRCRLMATSLDQVTLTGAKLIDCTFHGTKVRHLTLNDSTWQSSTINGSHLKTLSISDSDIARSTLHSVNLNDVAIRESGLDDVTFHSVVMAGTVIENSRVTKSSYQSLNLSGMTLRDCSLRRVQFRADTATVSLEGAEFTDMVLINCRFVNCNFRDAKLTGFTLSGVTLRDVDLAGGVFTDAESFLTAAGSKQAS